MKVFGMIRVTGRSEFIGFLVFLGLFLESAIEGMYLSDELFDVLNLFGVEWVRIFGLLEDVVFHI